MCLLYKAACWSTCSGKGNSWSVWWQEHDLWRLWCWAGAQEPLSLSLGVFFTTLKNSNIRNHVKVSLTTVKAASVNSMSWRQKKGFANSLPVSCWRSCKPQSLLCEGVFSVLPCWWFIAPLIIFFMRSFFLTGHWKQPVMPLPSSKHGQVCADSLEVLVSAVTYTYLD